MTHMAEPVRSERSRAAIQCRLALPGAVESSLETAIAALWHALVGCDYSWNAYQEKECNEQSHDEWKRQQK